MEWLESSWSFTVRFRGRLSKNYIRASPTFSLDYYVDVLRNSHPYLLGLN